MSFNSYITQNVDAKFKDCEILNLNTEDLNVKGDAKHRALIFDSLFLQRDKNYF